MHGQEATHSRPTTPESPLTSSLYHATSTIDDLTLALANFSRVPSPEPPSLLVCCCGKDECDNAKAWLAFKSQLESRLILSAEVGQALLQRHEAYVRQHERRHKTRSSSRETQREHNDDGSSTTKYVDIQVDDLIREKAALEKRLTQALINNEVTEASNKTILEELQEARRTISRLTVNHARSVGWDTRLSAAMKEKDDMQQERDSESQRARVAESRIAALNERTSKLQAEVRHLQHDLEQRRLHRLESTESILQDARARLETMQQSRLGNPAMVEQTELTKVLESLVDDNEVLKRDNAELQSLLAESREDLHALQEEVEEQRANAPSHAGAGTLHSRQQFYTGSVPSSTFKEHSLYHFTRRTASLERKPRRAFEPLTPETSRRPLSPTDSLTPSETKWTSFSHPHPSYPPSSISFDGDDDGQRDTSSSSPEKPRPHKSLFLLSRSRGVQTDGWSGPLSPSPIPSHVSSSSPPDPRSESSSFSESQSSQMSILVERVVSLLHRMTQADALTLTNRLKRQHLRGADVGHLSRSTVSGIISEATDLRTQFRALLEDDKVITTCTRKDLRVLFKLFRDIFSELGQMRVTLNEVILDPSFAGKVRELALDPEKAEADQQGGRDTTNSYPAGGWMAPISKLFGSPSGRGEGSSADRGVPSLLRSGSSRGTTRPPPRVIPKLGPALSASATTVNVEFTGTGVGRSVTSTFSAHPSRASSSTQMPSTSQQASTGVMGIFAGAPRSAGSDPWVVIPNGSRKNHSSLKPDLLSPPPFRRSPMNHGGNPNRLSRNVDAVIDVDSPSQGDEEPDYLAPLLQRTLRRRGMSDSSIHSTFTSQADELRSPPINVPMVGGLSPRQTSVFQALSRTVQSFRLAGSTLSAGSASGSDTGTSPPQSSTNIEVAPPQAKPETGPRASSPSLTNLIPNLSSWAVAGNVLDPMTGTEPFFVRGAREDSALRRPGRAGETFGADYF